MGPQNLYITGAQRASIKPFGISQINFLIRHKDLTGYNASSDLRLDFCSWLASSNCSIDDLVDVNILNLFIQNTFSEIAYESMRNCIPIQYT